MSTAVDTAVVASEVIGAVATVVPCGIVGALRRSAVVDER